MDKIYKKWGVKGRQKRKSVRNKKELLEGVRILIYRLIYPGRRL